MLLDFIIAGLLAATIGYCVVLNRKLAGLRGVQDELLELVKVLDVVTGKAERSIAELKSIGLETGGMLESQSAAASALCDELRIICESGNNLANRLESRLLDAGKTARRGGTGRLQPVSLAARDPATAPGASATRSGPSAGEKGAPEARQGGTDREAELENELLDSLRQVR